MTAIIVLLAVNTAFTFFNGFWLLVLIGDVNTIKDLLKKRINLTEYAMKNLGKWENGKKPEKIPVDNIKFPWEE